MRIIGVDQSLTSAAAVRIEEVSLGHLVIESYDHFTPKSSGIYRLADHRDWVMRKMSNSYDLLAREQHHMRQYGNAGALQQLTAVLDLAAYDNNLVGGNGYAVISPSTWKKFMAGKGNLAKDTNYMRILLKEIEDCPLIDSITFEIPNDDVADAICIGVTAYAAWRFVEKIDETIPKGYKEWPVKAANMFEHGKR